MHVSVKQFAPVFFACRLDNPIFVDFICQGRGCKFVRLYNILHCQGPLASKACRFPITCHWLPDATLPHSPGWKVENSCCESLIQTSASWNQEELHINYCRLDEQDSNLSTVCSGNYVFENRHLNQHPCLKRSKSNFRPLESSHNFPQSSFDNLWYPQRKSQNRDVLGQHETTWDNHAASSCVTQKPCGNEMRWATGRRWESLQHIAAVVTVVVRGE